ncbi:hypothetical protein [Geminocystis herdmanii]|uniref:hypothetical protein n=1 Tax=Geminocystis herdmanii TaxID=669359 RepID=UPI00034C676E|nr:hypothetical protein [Geminocystis herdmanii]
MLSTDIRQEIIVKRIEDIVSILMSERPLFKEELDYDKTVTHLAEVFEKALSVNEFNNVSEESLKNRCSGIMSLHLLAKIGEEFTPKQMAIFDDAIKRK